MWDYRTQVRFVARLPSCLLSVPEASRIQREAGRAVRDTGPCELGRSEESGSVDAPTGCSGRNSGSLRVEVSSTRKAKALPSGTPQTKAHKAFTPPSTGRRVHGRIFKSAPQDTQTPEHRLRVLPALLPVTGRHGAGKSRRVRPSSPCFSPLCLCRPGVLQTSAPRRPLTPHRLQAFCPLTGPDQNPARLPCSPRREKPALGICKAL